MQTCFYARRYYVKSELVSQIAYNRLSQKQKKKGKLNVILEHWQGNNNTHQIICTIQPIGIVECTAKKILGELGANVPNILSL